MTQPAWPGVMPSRAVTPAAAEASQVTAGDLQFSGKLSELMAIRDLSERQVARRVPCTAGHVSNLANASERPTRHIAAQLDQVLDAGGELLALAEATTSVTTRPTGNPGGGNPAPYHGLSLCLPYVPGRLVIEISGTGMPEERLPTP
jgi:hypothetical protein